MRAIQRTAPIFMRSMKYNFGDGDDGPGDRGVYHWQWADPAGPAVPVPVTVLRRVELKFAPVCLLVVLRLRLRGGGGWGLRCGDCGRDSRCTSLVLISTWLLLCTPAWFTFMAKCSCLQCPDCCWSHGHWHQQALHYNECRGTHVLGG